MNKKTIRIKSTTNKGLVQDYNGLEFLESDEDKCETVVIYQIWATNLRNLYQSIHSMVILKAAFSGYWLVHVLYFSNMVGLSVSWIICNYLSAISYS